MIDVNQAWDIDTALAAGESLADLGLLWIEEPIDAQDHAGQALLAQFAGLGISNALIVGGAEIDANFGRAARNIPGVDVLPIQGINVYDILRRNTLVLSKAAVDALEERFNGRP